MPTVSLSGVSKSFAGQEALHEVALTIEAGQRVALLGHNGAGKSTLMKIILGLLPPDSGDIRVLDAPAGSAAARAGVAYLPENVAFHPALSALEQIRLYLRLRGQSPDQAAPLLARVGLSDAAGRRIGTYSKGMRQRVGLAQALIGRPRLLVLDEPTSGLDPVSRHDFYTILDRLALEGAAILLSSHALSEVAARTDRIVILSRGRVMADDTLAGLRRRAALPTRIQIAARPDTADRVAGRLAAGRRNGVMVELDCAGEDKIDRLADITAMAALIDDLEVIPPSLDDIYNHFSRRAHP